jgi:UPF0271 protein
MPKQIDINCDIGERLEALLDGTDETLMRLISSANIACGGHAGDTSTMEKTVQLACANNVAIGAHPSYPDRTNFGRTAMNLSAEEIERIVFEQIQSLGEIVAKHNCALVHVKPHGALYNVAAKNPSVAQAITNGVARWSKDVILVGLAGSVMLDVWRESGFKVAGEAFADRLYEPNGSLRSRKFSDALITDSKKAAEQAVSIITAGKVAAADGTEIQIDAQTICVHSDTPNAVSIVTEIRRQLTEEGIEIKSFYSMER